jgi:hypothetical protein
LQPCGRECRATCRLDLEDRNQVVFFLVELAVDGAEDVFYFAAGYVSGDSPAEG